MVYISQSSPCAARKHYKHTSEVIPPVVDVFGVQGGSVHDSDQWGGTALYWATYRGHRDVVDVLLGWGADPAVRNQQVR